MNDSTHKVIIAGSRTITLTNDELDAYLKAFLDDDQYLNLEVVCGMANGVDKCGERYAIVGAIPITRFPANWDLGRGAGFIRNAEMAKYADALLLIFDGQSKGSLNMKQQMQRLKKPIYEIIWKK